MSLHSYPTHQPLHPGYAMEPTLPEGAPPVLPGLWLDLPPGGVETGRQRRSARRRIEQFATATTLLGQGRGELVAPVDGEDEMSLLARAFNALAAQVQAREERLRAALQRERRITTTLQQAFVPQSLPQCSGYSFAASYHPALEEAAVGGDFYDVFALPDGRIGLLLGDVAGKGLEAANTATMTRYMTRAYALQSAAPAEVLASVNRALYDSVEDLDLFVTAVYAVLDPKAHALRFAIAGHWPALVTRRQRVEVVGGRSLALGIAPEAAYKEQTVSLQPGDSLLLYTDGLVEDGPADPMQRLREVKRSLAHRRTEPLERTVVELHELAQRRSGGRLRDDLTLLAVRRD